MTTYEQIIANLKDANPTQAELMEDEINIIIHKLKFLPQDSFPTVVIISQHNNFQAVYNPLLAEKVQLAGGKLASDMSEDPQVILVMQSSDDLFQVLPSYLTDLKAQKTRALLENKIFVLQTNINENKDESYVRDTEILAEIIQHKYFFYGREGSDWLKFDFA